MTRTLITCLLAAATTLAHPQSKDSKKQGAASTSPTASQGQAAQTTTAPPSLLKRDEKAPDIAPDQTVITVRGLCPADTAATGKPAVPSTQECVTRVTREQFDNLVKAFNPNNQAVPPAARRKLAEAYVEILTFSEAAKSAGVENNPMYAEVMRVLRLRTLADMYRNELAEQLRNPPQQEIEAYYRQNQAKFEGAKLSRIYLPKNPDPKATPEQTQEYPKKVQQVADDIQARAAKGEDAEKLQKDAYTALGISAAPSSTGVSNARHGMFPPKIDQEIFSHKAGEVFRSDEGTGTFIYRVESREPLPLESVKEQIAQQIFRSKMEEKTKELTAPVHADFDEKYFGPPAAAATPAMPPRPPNPAK